MVYSNEYIHKLMFEDNSSYNDLVPKSRISFMFIFINYKGIENKVMYHRLKRSALGYVAKQWTSFRNVLKPFTTEKANGDLVIDFPYDDLDWIIFPLFLHELPDNMKWVFGIEDKDEALKESDNRKKKKKKVHKEGRLTEEEKAVRRQERKADRRIDSLMVQSNIELELDRDIRKILRRGIREAPVHEELAEKKQVDIRFISLDIGVKNFCTVCSNVFAPYLISGQRMVNALGHYESLYNHDDFGRYALTNKYSRAKREKRLDKRNEILHDFIVSVCDRLMQNVTDYNIDTIIFGYPDIWSKKTGFESKDVSIMFQRTLANFKEMLKKRCSRHDIKFVEIDEAYTSVCSFIDNENIGKKREYCGKRVTRDKYFSKQGYQIHADVNASYNIAKKYLVNKGIWSDKYFTQMVAMLNNSRFIFVLKQGYDDALAEEIAKKEAYKVGKGRATATRSIGAGRRNMV